MSPIPRDPWSHLGERTAARIALGRTGASLPTRELLDFGIAHAQARDAVQAHLDATALVEHLSSIGIVATTVESEAVDRAHYLRRPDLGRTLSAPSRTRLEAIADQTPSDVALVVADGLSAKAVALHAPALLHAFVALAGRNGLSLGPTVIARGGRVALGDEIGFLVRARSVAVIIGERPGLSAPDSLGIYLTHAPRPGRTDADRNCISNVRPAGLLPERAAASLVWLVAAALQRGATGIHLKDESGHDAKLDFAGLSAKSGSYSDPDSR